MEIWKKYLLINTLASDSLRLKPSSLHMFLRGNISTDDCPRELFKPSKDSASLGICIEKNFWLGIAGFL